MTKTALSSWNSVKLSVVLHGLSVSESAEEQQLATDRSRRNSSFYFPDVLLMERSLRMLLWLVLCCCCSTATPACSASAAQPSCALSGWLDGWFVCWSGSSSPNEWVARRRHGMANICMFPELFQRLPGLVLVLVLVLLLLLLLMLVKWQTNA